MSPDRRGPGNGVLVAVVGPSGAGKDALMSAAARQSGRDPGLCVVRRIVTRVALAASEDHDSLDEAGFDRAEAAGAFALTWAAHGLRYALPRSAATAVAGGATVMANLSRRALGDAAVAFGRLHVVEVTARADILFARLVSRAREDEATIRARLRREAPVLVPPTAEGHLRLDNSGDLDAAAAILMRYLGRLGAYG